MEQSDRAIVSIATIRVAVTAFAIFRGNYDGFSFAAVDFTEASGGRVNSTAPQTLIRPTHL